MAKHYAVKARNLLAKHGASHRPKSLWVGWTPPEGGWVKLNTMGLGKERQVGQCGWFDLRPSWELDAGLLRKN